MMAAVLLATFVLAILLVTGIYYLVYHPRTLTTSGEASGEAVDLGLTVALVAMIVLVTAALSAMYLLGKLQ